MDKNPAIESLLTLIQKAESFVSDDYISMAKQNSTNLQMLREIYLCACDELPAKEVQNILDKELGASYLRQYRYDCIDEIRGRKSKNTLGDIALLTDTIQKKIETIGKNMKDIEQNSSDLNDMFIDIKPPAEALVMEARGFGKPALNAGTANVNEKQSGTMSGNGEVRKSDFKKKRLKRRQKRDIAAYVTLLSSEGYTAEQISYVLDCAQRGMKPKEIEEFIHPGLTVDMMERIRQMKERNSTDNGF